MSQYEIADVSRIAEASRIEIAEASRLGVVYGQTRCLTYIIVFRFNQHD